MFLCFSPTLVPDLKVVGEKINLALFLCQGAYSMFSLTVREFHIVQASQYQRFLALPLGLYPLWHSLPAHYLSG